MFPLNLKKSSVLLGSLLCYAPVISLGADATWVAGGASSREWSVPANWNGLPSGAEVIFGTAGWNTGAVTNIVDSNLSISSLSYGYSSTVQQQHTEIAEDVTLTLGGGASSNVLLVGGLRADTASNSNPIQQTNTTISGLGALSINAAGKNILVANYRNTTAASLDGSKATLDLSGLANFAANLGSGQFLIGSTLQASGNYYNTSKVLLAKESTLTMARVAIGSSAGGPVTSTATAASELILGKTTTLNTNTLDIGAGPTQVSGKIAFAGNAGSTLLLRGSNGTDAVADVRVGYRRATASSSTQNGVLDLTGGIVDALITNLWIAEGASNSSSGTTTSGVFTIDGGTVKVNNLVIGRSEQTAGSTTAGVSGTINVNGGTFTATERVRLAERTHASGVQKINSDINITSGGVLKAEKGISMGSSANAGGGALTATITINGGALIAGGTIEEGSNGGVITSELALKSGTLNLGGNAVSVDAFVLESGVFKNAGEVNSGGAVTKTTAGTLTLEGVNSYIGATIVGAGTLKVNGTLSTSNVTVASGAKLGGHDGILGGNTLLQTGSGMAFSLNAATGYDSLHISNLTLQSGVDLALTLGFDPLSDTGFTLVHGNYIGTFATVNGMAFGEGGTFALNFEDQSYQFQLHYNLGSIQAMVVPEPGILGIFGLGGLLLIGFRSRRP